MKRERCGRFYYFVDSLKDGNVDLTVIKAWSDDDGWVRSVIKTWSWLRGYEYIKIKCTNCGSENIKLYERHDFEEQWVCHTCGDVFKVEA